jgi:hypothetical protein
VDARVAVPDLDLPKVVRACARVEAEAGAREANRRVRALLNAPIRPHVRGESAVDKQCARTVRGLPNAQALRARRQRGNRDAARWTGAHTKDGPPPCT